MNLCQKIIHNFKMLTVFTPSTNLVMSDPLWPHGLWTPPGPSVHGVFQASLLEWSGLPFPPQGDLPNPGIKLSSLASSVLATGILYQWATWHDHEESSRIITFYNSYTFYFMRAHNIMYSYTFVNSFMYRSFVRLFLSKQDIENTWHLWCYALVLCS